MTTTQCPPADLCTECGNLAVEGRHRCRGKRKAPFTFQFQDALAILKPPTPDEQEQLVSLVETGGTRCR